MLRSLMTVLLAAPFAALGAERAPMPKPAVAKDPEPIPFADVVAAAEADLATVDPSDLPYVRYFDARAFAPSYRKEAKAVFDYHINGLSRKARIAKAREVTPWLWAVRTSDYGWPAAAFEDLARVNVYYVLPVEIRAAPVPTVVQKREIKKSRQVAVSDGRGGVYYRTEEYVEFEDAPLVGPVKPPVTKELIPAPWLPPTRAAELGRVLGTRTPIVRADQFVFRTGAQSDRKGHGYYDFFGFAKRADVEAFVRLDRKAAIELQKELGAMVATSGVTLNNRQLFRYQALTGAYWESRDVKDNLAKRNALSNFLDDYEHDVEEIVFTLPNGLPGYYLSDNKGNQADVAPDFIASDHRATNNDRRIHVGMSCVVCHNEGGLRHIQDYARALYNPKTGIFLGNLKLDRDRAERVENAYLGPLKKAYTEDTTRYSEAIEEASGLKPGELARAYERFWALYLDAPVTLDRAALEVGMTPRAFREALIARARQKGLVDPILATYLAADPLPVRREHFEERFGLLMLTLGGANP